MVGEAVVDGEAMVEEEEEDLGEEAAARVTKVVYLVADLILEVLVIQL